MRGIFPIDIAKIYFPKANSVTIQLLTNQLPLFPPQIHASTIPALLGRGRVPGPAIPANLHEQPTPLGNYLLKGISDRHPVIPLFLQRLATFQIMLP